VLAGVVAVLVIGAIIDEPSSPRREPAGHAPAPPATPWPLAEVPLLAPPDTIPDQQAEHRKLESMIEQLLGPETEPATRAWAKDLLDGDEEQRAEAVRELGFLDDRRWVPVVIAVLSSEPQAAVRAAAAAALANDPASPTAAHALTTALTDRDSDVREDALLSLKAIRNQTVETDLRQLLTAEQLDADTDREVRLFLDRYYPHLDPLVDPLAK